MSRTNPRIEAQREVLQRLVETEFDTESYTGEFIDSNWTPQFHLHQGIENFRRVIQEELDKLDTEEDEWRKRKGLA